MKKLFGTWFGLLLALSLGSANLCQATVVYDWVTVGDPGNAPDDTGYGAVDEEFRMGRFEVTNRQYTEFLNAVASDDTNDLYITEMTTWPGGAVNRSGSDGNYSYRSISGWEDKPIVYVTLWSAMRFANWLHNGQPGGNQDASTTEDGAYTLTADGIVENTIRRNPNASIFVPSEDQWYKSAFYKAGGDDTGYWDFATGTDEVPAAIDPPGSENAAGYNREHRFTDVGAYSLSPSPYGTFDQSGNAWEWTEEVLATNSVIIRGGSTARDELRMAADWRQTHTPHRGLIGFRLASRAIQPGTGDFDGNGVVDVADIDLLLAETAVESHTSIFDLTADGRVDQADISFWVKDIYKTWFGDANLDGRFNTADLVSVFITAKYERDVDAGWADGDWTGDRRFTTADFVAVGSDGGFEQDVRRAVPEPTSGLALWLGALMLLRARRRQRCL